MRRPNRIRIHCARIRQRIVHRIGIEVRRIRSASQELAEQEGIADASRRPCQSSRESIRRPEHTRRLRGPDILRGIRLRVARSYSATRQRRSSPSPGIDEILQLLHRVPVVRARETLIIVRERVAERPSAPTEPLRRQLVPGRQIPPIRLKLQTRILPDRRRRRRSRRQKRAQLRKSLNTIMLPLMT